MFQLFQKKCPNYKLSYLSYYLYFKENFDYLKFGQPQKDDACVTCEELSVKIKSNQLCDNVKRAAAAELIVHKRRSKKCYEAMKKCKNTR